jgi:hypothetical protein
MEAFIESRVLAQSGAWRFPIITRVQWPENAGLYAGRSATWATGTKGKAFLDSLSPELKTPTSLPSAEGFRKHAAVISGNGSVSLRGMLCICVDMMHGPLFAEKGAADQPWQMVQHRGPQITQFFGNETRA